ncbi:MAG: GPR endopeptidase [Clostridiales bacterium]|nr:GPR endopeptidase [Clostridiales bacterium]
MRNYRTDLVIEAPGVDAREGPAGLPGVSVSERRLSRDILVTTVAIEGEAGEAALGRPRGTYVTIESGLMKENEPEAHEEIMRALADELGRLHSLPEEAQVLVAGLGNRNVTPDALGPKVVARTLVTRHLGEAMPKGIAGRLRPVSAIAPGVMGQTGAETGEIIAGIAEKVKPDLIIAVDALAARRASRINATIQMSDTGISPGAGVGSRRMSIDEKTLGVPVIAVGVPTVVDAATLVGDTIDICLEQMISETERGSDFYKMLSELEREEKYGIIRKILDPYDKNMFVTPKEVDAVVERLAAIIGNAINIGIHKGITKDDIDRYSRDLAN